MSLRSYKERWDSLIQVSDNGSGMDYDDAVNAFKAHATSKLHDHRFRGFDDHGFSWRSLGLISSRCKSYLKTRTENDDDGTPLKLKVESWSDMNHVVLRGNYCYGE